jgi:LysM repeat protein
METETALPKNLRQIGEIQGREKICIEDYVMTYIRKKEPQEEKGYLGIFLGERKEQEEAEYVFIRGILEVDFSAEKENETEMEIRNRQKEALEKAREEYFSGWEVQGCCVIGAYRPQNLDLLAAIVPEAGQLIYHLQEQEETLYWKRAEQYERLRGYFVFYEQNRKMQEYMAEIFKDTIVEKEGLSDRAIKSFREKMKEKGEKKTGSLLKLASSFFVVTVLVIGAVVVNRVDEIRNTQDTSGAADTALSVQTQAGTAASQGEAASADSTVTAQVQTDSSASADSVQTQTDSSASAASAAVQQEGEYLLASAYTASAEETDSNAASVSQITDSTTVTASAGDTASQQSVETTETVEITTDIDTAQSESGTTTASADAAAASETEETAEVSARAIHASYVIRQGDTLASICSRYYGGLDRLEELCDANDIEDADLIMPGQKIVLP